MISKLYQQNTAVKWILKTFPFGFFWLLYFIYSIEYALEQLDSKRLTAKRMYMLYNAKELFGFRNVWTLDRRIYYLAESCSKP